MINHEDVEAQIWSFTKTQSKLAPKASIHCKGALRALNAEGDHERLGRCGFLIRECKTQEKAGEEMGGWAENQCHPGPEG